MLRRITRFAVVLAVAAAIFGVFSAAAFAGNISITVSPSNGGSICATYDHYTTAGWQWNGTYECPLTNFSLAIYGDASSWWIYHFTPTAAPGYTFTGWTGDCLGLGVCDYDSRVASSSATANFAPTTSVLAAKLVTDTNNVKPGTALSDKAAAIQAAVSANNTATACSAITNFLGLVKAQTGKKLNSTQASLLTGDANSLAAALGC